MCVLSEVISLNGNSQGLIYFPSVLWLNCPGWDGIRFNVIVLSSSTAELQYLLKNETL